ncbi:MAG: hypothetical protein E7265_09950, partial [Lachnospiraceae bacterium]|nr:hypothetical protein [Lachnospiraceae bacterium]
MSLKKRIISLCLALSLFAGLFQMAGNTKVASAAQEGLIELSIAGVDIIKNSSVQSNSAFVDNGYPAASIDSVEEVDGLPVWSVK